MMVSSSNESLFLNRGVTGLLSAAHCVACVAMLTPHLSTLTMPHEKINTQSAHMGVVWFKAKYRCGLRICFS